MSHYGHTEDSKMAAIRRRGDRINVQIRKKGYPFISKSFVSLTVAKKWAATTEADMERRLHVVIPDDTTVGNLLDGTTGKFSQLTRVNRQRNTGWETSNVTSVTCDWLTSRQRKSPSTGI